MKLFLLLLLSITFSLNAKILVAKWDGPITPITADFVERIVKKAERERAKVLILQLNTPGGLVESMRKIIQSFSSTNIPVVVYVYPPGGRAASAGAIITVSADVAVMAPGTNIGAAHPVQLAPAGEEKKDKKDKKEKDNKSVMMEKALQDMLAFVRSIAKEKGRNVKVVEKMVKESLALSADEALKEGVIDLIARDMGELLEKIDGRKVKKFGIELQIRTKGEEVAYVEESLREQVLKILTNPTVAYFLLMIGFYGILFELYNPGTVIPGVLGGISLILGLYGLSVISINWLGLLLIVLGILLFVLELITPTFGALAVGGIVSLALGSLFLIDTSSPYGDIPVSAIVTAVFTTALFFLIAGRFGLKAQKKKKMTGMEGMIGEVGTVISDFKGGKGKVRVHGEIWNAVSKDKLKKGEEVRVVAVEGLKVRVEKLSS